MQEDTLKKALSGELNEAEMKDFESKLSEEGKKIFGQAQAFKAKKKDEEEKAKKAEELVKQQEDRLQKLKDEIKGKEETLSSLNKSTDQFRKEQITKAKEKFFKEFSIPPEKQAEYESTFEKVDSGKVDPDLIFKDFVGVHSYLNSSEYVELKKKEEEMKKGADRENMNNAGGQSSKPSGDDNKDKKYPDKAVELSKKAGISLDAAARQVTNGMSRILE